MRRALQTVLVITALPMIAAPVAAQRTVIPDAPRCAQCTVTLTHAARLVGSDADLGPVTHVGEDSRGNLYTPVLYDVHVVNVYDSDGRHTGTIGRRGSGPGEFRSVLFLRIHDDTLFVHDNGLARQSVFWSGALVRTRRVPGNMWDGLSYGPDILINAVVPEGDAAGAPLHWIDTEGRRRASGGAASGRFRRDEIPLMRRSMAAASGSAFWTARPTRYLLEKWDHELNLVESIEREADWFPPHSNTGILPDRPPQPRVRAIHLDDEERMWVLLHVGAPRWRETFTSTAPSPDMAFDGRMDVYYDSVLEVIDTPTGSLVTRIRLDEYATAFTTTGKLVVYGDDEGIPYLDLFDVRLHHGR